MKPAADASNALGLQLLAQSPAASTNTLLSPLSIQFALAMTYAGADGQTREEMARVLHYLPDEAALHQAFAALQLELVKPEGAPAETSSSPTPPGRQRPSFTLQLANRLFADRTQDFLPAFLARARDTYLAPLELMDFVGSPALARQQINHWVEEQTRQRIRDLIPPDGVSRDTRLVLVNALYLKAPWLEEFPAHGTEPRPFHLPGGTAIDVPTLSSTHAYGFAQRPGYRVVTIPYAAGGLQFLIVLPDAHDGLPAVEKGLTASDLAAFAGLGRSRLELYLPKLRLEPPPMKLAESLRTLGMKTAFDHPQGSANFGRMARRKPDDYLFISEVFHKTFLELDEKGTEAAAATAVVMMRATAIGAPPPPPIEVRVDRPFLFAIQHRPSGACLFLGRVMDPRAL